MLRGAPEQFVAQRLDRDGEGGRVRRFHPGRPQPVRHGGAADGKGLRFVGRAAPLRIEGVEGLGRRVGKIAAGGDEQRRPHRGGHQDRRRDRALPVVFVDQRDRRGSLRDLGRGEDGERHAGRGGRSVGAADPGRVVGGKRRVAQLFGRFGGGGLLFLGRRFGCGLDRRRRGLFVLLVRAAATEHGGDEEDQRDQDETADRLQRRRDRLALPLCDWRRRAAPVGLGGRRHGGCSPPAGSGAFAVRRLCLGRLVRFRRRHLGVDGAFPGQGRNGTGEAVAGWSANLSGTG